MFSLSRLQRYGISVAGVILTAVLRLALNPILGHDLPLFLFVFPIVLASWFGGLGPGLLATGLSLLLGDYLFMTPSGSLLKYPTNANLMRMLILGFIGTSFSILFDTTRKAMKARLESQRFVQQILDVSPSAIYIYDVRQKKNVFVNRGMTRALGCREEDLQDPELIRSRMHPDDWQLFLDHVDRLLALSNEETAECEYRMRHSSGAWRWFRSRHKIFSRNKDGAVREIIGAAADVTDRKADDNKSHFLADLNQALLPLADPDEIMAVTVRMLGKYLDVDRCGYAELDQEDQFVVKGDYTRGATPSIVGRYRVSEFGENERRILRENRPYVINDIEAEAPVGADLSLYRRAQIRSLVCVPLTKGGSFLARMAVHQNTPRHWSKEEIELIATVANRCWESVERARAIRNLKESDERYRAFITNSSEAIWRFELERPIPVTLPDNEQIELLYQFAYLAECNDAMARMYGYDTASQIVGARIGDLLVRSDPQNLEFLSAFRKAGYRLTDAESREVDRYGNVKYFLNNLTGIQEDGVIVRGWGTQRDVTDQKRAAEALRASEERYRLLTELSPDGVVIATADGTIYLANPSTVRMLGTTGRDIERRNLFDFVAPEFQSPFRDYLSALIADGKRAAEVDATLRTQDGRTIPVEFSAVHFDWKEQPFVQIVIHDLSARKQAEADRERWLRDIEAERNRLTQILQQMPTGVLIAEAPSGRLLFHNVEAMRLLGHALQPSEDYKAYGQYGALHEDGKRYAPEEYPMARSLISGEVIKAEEMKYRRGDGTETMFSVHSAPIYDPDGHMVLTVATFMDIDERKRGEIALRESEERFARAFQATPDAMVISRMADGVILEVNDSFLTLSGYDRTELLGKTTLMLGLYADTEDRARAVAIVKERNRVRDLEFAMRRKSGEVRLILFSAEALELRGEHCWLTIGRDITERKQVEKERERLLLQEKAAREEAEAANNMKDEFLATISHELRTPLTAILGWIHMINGGSLSETQKHHAHEVIEQSAKSQARLVDDILDTARIIAGRFKLEAHPVEIERVFRATIDVMRPVADAKGIRFQAVIGDQDSVVSGDVNRLQQVIWNLLSNAVKFTNVGGSVEAKLTRSGNQIEISISDTGIGIDPKFMPYIFDRFRQADSTSTRRFGGLGLGLAIVRYVVEMHGGTVIASSAGKGRGATFIVRLPAASPEPRHRQTDGRPQSKSTQPAELTQERQSLRGLRLLVVEDDPDTLSMLSFALETNGAEVTTAASVDEALLALEHSRPDALISDLAMPDQDGYDFIMKVRARSQEQGGNIPAVALSSYTRPEDRTRALAAGFQVHVAKPVDPRELVDIIASVVGHPCV